MHQLLPSSSSFFIASHYDNAQKNGKSDHFEIQAFSNGLSLVGSVLICRGVPPWAPHLPRFAERSGGAHGGTPLQIRTLPVSSGSCADSHNSGEQPRSVKTDSVRFLSPLDPRNLSLLLLLVIPCARFLSYTSHDLEAFDEQKPP